MKLYHVSVLRVGEAVPTCAWAYVTADDAIKQAQLILESNPNPRQAPQGEVYRVFETFRLQKSGSRPLVLDVEAGLLLRLATVVVTAKGGSILQEENDRLVEKPALRPVPDIPILDVDPQSLHGEPTIMIEELEMRRPVPSVGAVPDPHVCAQCEQDERGGIPNPFYGQQQTPLPDPKLTFSADQAGKAEDREQDGGHAEFSLGARPPPGVKRNAVAGRVGARAAAGKLAPRLGAADYGPLQSSRRSNMSRSM